MGLALLRAKADTSEMLTRSKLLALFGTILLPLAALTDDKPRSNTPTYTNDAQMRFPEHYREWVYLTSGFDMNYSAAAMQANEHHTFDNVFVNPEAYAAFLEHGTWPDKTVMILELRNADGKTSIDKRGNSQGSVSGLEVHVKDEARFPGKWAFFSFDEGKTARKIPESATCYSCHAEHGAVDNTFVQFYPTLLPVAKEKSTLSAAYRKESAVSASK